jgi:hypothetical protein
MLALDVFGPFNLVLPCIQPSGSRLPIWNCYLRGSSTCGQPAAFYHLLASSDFFMITITRPPIVPSARVYFHNPHFLEPSSLPFRPLLERLSTTTTPLEIRYQVSRDHPSSHHHTTQRDRRTTNNSTPFSQEFYHRRPGRGFQTDQVRKKRARQLSHTIATCF